MSMRMKVAALLGLAAAAAMGNAWGGAPSWPTNADIVAAFAKQGIRINGAEALGIRDNVALALEEARSHGIGNSKVDFAAVEIAADLGLDTSSGSNTVKNVVGAIRYLASQGPVPERPRPRPWPSPPLAWEEYFDGALRLTDDAGFLGLVRQKGFHPVKISWEDIGRHEGSVWGDRISDVGIWVRRDEADPSSARLALSVRRDSNFRDKVLMVPSANIKIHQRLGGRTVEKTLPERLAELGLGSRMRDRNVIVSNQFAIVPVPARNMSGAWPDGVPPRAAFTFSIFPYGSTNLVITDVIEGSHEAIVGPGQHQLLFADIDGDKAPFTASRAQDRPDLLRLERELKAQGMDVDVQRYYLIQVPLRRGVANLRLSNMGTPPWNRGYEMGFTGPPPMPMPAPPAAGAAGGLAAESSKSSTSEKRRDAGLARVAIGHGEPEGPYFAGSGYSGARADEPVRVTVVYFVTPVGRVTRRDLESFATAFSQWDSQAIWGGSFVTKETN